MSLNYRQNCGHYWLGPCRTRGCGSAEQSWTQSDSLRASKQVKTVPTFSESARLIVDFFSRIGGLLQYGIPTMKLSKKDIVQRRVDLMTAEGIEFVTGVEVGSADGISAVDLHANNNAVLMAMGATTPRDLPIPGRDSKVSRDTKKEP